MHEQTAFGDIVVAPVQESYRRIVHQTMHLMSVLSRNKRVTHVLKVDDDSFVRARLLYRHVSRIHKFKLDEEEALIGNLEFHSQPIRDPSSKWYDI